MLRTGAISSEPTARVPDLPAPADDGMHSDVQAALHRVRVPPGEHGQTDKVVSSVLAAVKEAVACEGSAVFLHDDEADELVMFSTDHGVGTTVSLGEPTIVRRIFQTGCAEVLNAVLLDPDQDPLLSHTLEARQLVAAPLEVGGRRLGVLAAINSTMGAFTDADLRVFAMIADRAALTIDNGQLRAKVHRQAQELEGLQRLSRLFTASETVDHVAAESVRIVCDLLRCRRVALLLHDQEVDALIAQPRTVGFSEEEISLLRFSAATPSLVATVYRTDAALTSNNAKEDPWVDERLRSSFDFNSVLLAPMTTSGRPIGVLLVVDGDNGDFDEADARFATLLGSRVASVIEASRARERERGLVQRLREADHTKSEFVSMLAHELKGPMTAIKGFGDILESRWQTLSDERRNETLKIISKETERLSRLVNDLLDISRLEAGTLRYDFQPVDLREMVDGIVETHPSLTLSHRIEARLDEKLPLVAGDPDRIRQVFINLLTNAVRYSPDDTSIDVSTEVVEDQTPPFVIVSVRDEGIGIAPEHKTRVFEKFAMLPKPAWITKGTGLGLYITKGIVEAHGGRLWVESEPGKGSTFFFTLRIADV